MTLGRSYQNTFINVKTYLPISILITHCFITKMFYQTIHQEYMKYFKLPHINIIEVHDQSLWAQQTHYNKQQTHILETMTKTWYKHNQQPTRQGK